MKTKILLALLSLVLCLTLYSCAENEPAETTPAVTTEAATPEATPEVTPEETPEASPEVTTEAATLETTPEVTSEEIPETTPEESAPATTPGDSTSEIPETPPTETEQGDESLTAEQLDAICKEKFDFIDREYVGKITYLGSIDAGKVFIAYATPHSAWGAATTLKLGSYSFSGYGDYANDRGIYVYNSEIIREIDAVYHAGEISEDDLADVYSWWREYRVIKKFEEDYADQYKLISVERIIEFEKASLYLFNVSRETASDGAALTVGEYKFDGYGENAVLYVYKDLPFGNSPANEFDDSCDMGYTSDAELALIHEYWADNFGGK